MSEPDRSALLPSMRRNPWLHRALRWETGLAVVLAMLAIFVAVALLGVAAGLFNGLMVTRVGLPSLAVTIGTLALYRGIALIILGSNTISNFPGSCRRWLPSIHRLAAFGACAGTT